MLLKAGANINQLNSWKLSPVTVAFLKNHTNIVKKILDFPNINVNCKDDNGRTLIANTAFKFDLKNYALVDTLINKHNSNLKIMDIQKKYPAHHLLNNNSSINFTSQVISHNKSLIEDHAKLLTDFDASIKDLSNQYHGWVTAICNDLELLSRADEYGNSALTYYLTSNTLSLSVTGSKSFTSGNDRASKKNEFDEYRK